MIIAVDLVVPVQPVELILISDGDAVDYWFEEEVSNRRVFIWWFLHYGT